MIPGIVVELIKEVNRGGNGRTTSYVVADYYFGSGIIKRRKLTTRSVVSSEGTPAHAEMQRFLRTRLEPDNESQNPRSQEHLNPVSIPPPAVINPAPPPNVDAENVEHVEERTISSAGQSRDDLSPSVTVHDTSWYQDDVATQHDMNGPVLRRDWRVRDAAGNVLVPHCDGRGGRGNQELQMSRLEYFLMMFPQNHLQEMARLTNKGLAATNKEKTTVGELLKFFGVLILASKFEFQSRRSLWATTAPAKYIPAPAFGKTGMPRMRFDDLWKCIRWSDQPSERPDSMSSEQYRWKLVDDFVDKFNEHRAATFQPSDTICVDESISRWYGKGGHWINHGLPMYVAIDRKPENGCEIQSAACGRSGIMIRLKMVKTADEEDRQHELASGEGNNEQGLLHGATVMKELVLPWLHTDRIVCGDSYFASVPAALMLSRNGMRFIGVVKTATRQYPMGYLQRVELQDRGDRKGLVTRGSDGQPSLLAFVWMDRQRRYFISTASSLDAGAPYARLRWRQLDESPNAEPTRMELTVPQPKAAEIYYDACAMVDRHNRHRQQTLGLELKLGTHSWAMRVNLSIFSMIVVDTWLVYSQCTGTQEKQKEFYTSLSEELIDNTYDHVHNRRRRRLEEQDTSARSPELFDRTTGNPRAGTAAHLTPTKRRKTARDGSELPYSLQGRCRVCKKLTIYSCSLCMDENSTASEVWICYSKSGRVCFATHVTSCHDE